MRNLLVSALLGFALPLSAAACGICIEDKVAATYDFEVAAKATKNDHTVLFFEIAGLRSPDPKTRQAIIATVGKIPGIERGSVRVSLDPAAISVVFDAKRYPLAAMQKRIEEKLAAQHLRLKLLRLIQNGKLVEPVAPVGG